MVVVNSAGALTVPWQHGLAVLSRACPVVAIAALGMKTSFLQVTQAGWRAMLLIAVETTRRPRGWPVCSWLWPHGAVDRRL